ncbi:hypothetical protein ACONDI_01981 [Natranaerofaba carboxydovora]|nr:hypothetical protein ACONDI_01981 [Natranaerofaba carboxydovora]
MEVVKIKKYHPFFVIFLLICFSFSLLGCSINVNKDTNSNFSEEVQTSNFALSIEGPKKVEAGEEFELKGTIKYIGEEELKLLHGESIIRFRIIDEKDNYFDTYEPPLVQTQTNLKPGEKIEIVRNLNEIVKDSRKIIENPGQYEIYAKTTTLIDGEKEFSDKYSDEEAIIKDEIVTESVKIEIKEESSEN